MKYYSPSVYNAFNICKRQAWLMLHQLTADQYNEFISIGRLIEEKSFKKDKKEIYLADIGAKLDAIFKKDGMVVIAEIKKSSKTLNTGIVQLKYYLYLLKIKKNIVTKGVIKIPSEKISKEIILTQKDILIIESTLEEMKKILSSSLPPKLDKVLSVCPKCGHYEFCWS